MDDHRVTVVVVTWNGAECIERCLDSIIGQPYLCRIIVIDNDSSDETVEILGRYGDEIEYYASAENLGFGRGNNKGIELALSDQDLTHVLLLNQDAWLSRGCVETLLEVSTSEPDYVVLSPLHLNEDESALDPYFSIVATPPSCFGWINALALGQTPASIYEAKMVNAAVWLISRRGLEECGGFDPLFPHYGEDDEYCWRVRQLGYRIGIVTQARAVHARISGKSRRKLGFHEQIRHKALRQYIPALIALRIDKPLLFVLSKWSLKFLIKSIACVFRGEFKLAISFLVVEWLMFRNVLRISQNARVCATRGMHFLSKNKIS